jgi:soluble lytic murein transglycosylase-like protein
VNPRWPFLAVAVVLLLATPFRASAETFRLVAPDGTVYYTNAPRDPSYQRMGIDVPRRPESARAVPVLVREPGGYLHHVRDASTRYGVPEKLVTAVIRAESHFNPRAVSPKGARGLMQLMPQTASLLGVRDSFDPAENIDGGVRHLRRLIERFSNNVPLALAAYNAGENAVTQYRGIPPYPETQGYVQRVMLFFNGGGGFDSPLAPIVHPTYRFTDADGTVVYSNHPPAAAARLVRR